MYFMSKIIYHVYVISLSIYILTATYSGLVWFACLYCYFANVISEVVVHCLLYCDCKVLLFSYIFKALKNIWYFYTKIARRNLKVSVFMSKYPRKPIISVFKVDLNPYIFPNKKIYHRKKIANTTDWFNTSGLFFFWFSVNRLLKSLS
jgi:hypothetical protein